MGSEIGVPSPLFAFQGPEERSVRVAPLGRREETAPELTLN